MSRLPVQHEMRGHRHVGWEPTRASNKRPLAVDFNGDAASLRDDVISDVALVRKKEQRGAWDNDETSMSEEGSSDPPSPGSGQEVL